MHERHLHATTHVPTTERDMKKKKKTTKNNNNMGEIPEESAEVLKQRTLAGRVCGFPRS